MADTLANANQSREKVTIECFEWECTRCLNIFAYRDSKHKGDLIEYCPTCGSKFQAYFKGINERTESDITQEVAPAS